jgi:hypothetical protein
MKTLLDIGIDIEGIMNVFIPRQSEIPFEESNRIKLSNLENSELLLHIYEGVCIENKRNHLMKTIQLENVRDGFFLVQMKLMEKNGNMIVRVMADNIILDDIECTKEPQLWIDNSCEEDDQKRGLYYARNSFIEFVDNAHEFLHDPDVKPHIKRLLQTNEDHMYFEEMMKRLNEAVKVIELCDDVTKDEYILMLEEITEIVNPFISRIQMIVKRETIL